MRPLPACVWGLVTIGWAVAAFAQPGTADPEYTNKVRFAIPFRSDPAEIQRLGSREVRLFVTVDGGVNWHQVQSATPAANRFTVRAPKDGSYWFAVRTIDREGRRHPETELAPELAVVVDTKSPTLSIKLTQPATGRVQLTWEAGDAHLDVSSLLLESRQNGEKHWKRVYVSQAAAGRTSWDATGGGIVEVRGRISDKASNVTVAQDSVRVAAAKTSVPRQDVPDFKDPLAPSKHGPEAMADRFPKLEVPAGGGPYFGDAGPGTQSPNRRSSDTQTPGTHSSATREEDRPGGRSPNGGPTIARSPRPVQPIHPVDPKPLPRFPQFPPAREIRREPPKPSVPVRIVNRRHFRLNYTLDKIGRSGIDAVELFITTNDGRKWYRYGSDSDRKSPFAVTVPQDGAYGFAIRVRSGVGISDPPPKHGDAPAIKVVVDQTPPKLELLPILQGRGPNSNKFLIRWKMAEAQPAAQPISLSYAETASGPWKTMTGWTADSGRYLWTTPGDVPPRLYIRATARDRGGNISFVQTPRPIIIDTVRPSAKITTIDAEGIER
ncbi:MAG: hypothetical protein ACE5KM_10680 [Planctomycetaceae bacterium]